MDATTVAVDLAKDIFEVAMANRANRITERKRLTRRQFERFIDTLPVGTEVIMEKCGTAHYWGRRCQARDVRVRLLPVQYVRPYVRRNRTDRTDTEALLEANRCGGIRPAGYLRPSVETLCIVHDVPDRRIVKTAVVVWGWTRTDRLTGRIVSVAVIVAVWPSRLMPST